MRILIVEDEQKMANLLKRGLEEETHSVMLAHDGHEGFEMSQTYPFDVIVLDGSARSIPAGSRTSRLEASFSAKRSMDDGLVLGGVRPERREVTGELYRRPRADQFF